MVAVALILSMGQFAAAEVSKEELQSISTPDKVKTSLGELKFFDGIPTDETVQKVYDNLDRMRGVQVFLNTLPGASMYRLRAGNAKVGADKSNKVALFSQLLDSRKKPMDGAKTYQLHLPPNVPVNNFWAVTMYDTQTRSQLQTSNPYPTLGSQSKGFKQNADGSYDICFGPKPPQGKESNWLETIPGKSWFTILRMYGPLEPWINKTWRPSEIELVK